MNTKVKVLMGEEAKSKLKEGVDLVANATKVTLGAKGKNVLIKRIGMMPHITKDGVTVSRHVVSDDPFVQAGVEVAQEASYNTARKVGDGTTSSVVLLQSLIEKGMVMMNNGYNSVEIKSGMEYAVEDIREELESLTSKTDQEIESLIRVATVSANGDEGIGKVVAESVFSTGRSGAVTVNRSLSGKHEWELVDGMQVEIGYFHFNFINNPSKLRSELKDVAVLVSNLTISSAKLAVQIMEGAKRLEKDLFVVARDIDGEALNVFLANKNKGTINVCVSKLPEMGDHGDYMIEDICTMTGANVMSLRTGSSNFSTTLFGHCSYIQCNDETTIFKGGAGKKEDVDLKIKDITTIISESKVDQEKDFHKKRLAAITGGIGEVRIWANSEVEIKELADRVDDAIHATKAAMEEGVVAGGGVTLAHCKSVLFNRHEGRGFKDGEECGYKLVVDCLDVPYLTILENAGIHLGEDVSTPTYPMGINVQSNKSANMIESGIIDPKKVVRVCIENSVSVAATFLTTETAIIEYND